MHSLHLYFPGDRLSEAELFAACLDGHLAPVGEAFLPADAVETAALRAASLAPLLGGQLAATGLSAAWIHGALAFPPGRHSAQRVSAQRRGHILDRRIEYHDRRLDADQVMVLGGVHVTTPTRTLADLVRVADAAHREAAEMMVRTGIADAHTAVQWLHSAGPLPNKRAGLTLLRALAADQPEVTR
ncbi:hypothetical protein [Microbacterium luticocti]|uniref:hypothetical protein n=1 Tax=Microbacterium luticocti TaxID=451764 RepID=UPI000419EE73|nr:hypothetical protein [Microbacterium luticocti]